MNQSPLQIQYPSLFGPGIPTELIGVGPDNVTHGWKPVSVMPSVRPDTSYLQDASPSIFDTSFITPVVVPDMGYEVSSVDPVVIDDRSHSWTTTWNYDQVDPGIGPDNVVMGFEQPPSQPVLPVEYRYQIPFRGFLEFEDGDFPAPAAPGVSNALISVTGLHVLSRVDRRRAFHQLRLNAGALGDGLEVKDGKISIIGPSGLWTVTTVKTSAYTAVYDELVRADPSGGAFTVTIPTAVGFGGRQVAVKNVTASMGHITLDPTGSETIDGALTIVMALGYESLTLASDGTNWMII